MDTEEEEVGSEGDESEWEEEEEEEEVRAKVNWLTLGWVGLVWAKLACCRGQLGCAGQLGCIARVSVPQWDCCWVADLFPSLFTPPHPGSHAGAMHVVWVSRGANRLDRL